MATYRPDPSGAWLAAVRGRVALLAPITAADAVAAVWAELGAPDPTPQVLDRLTASGLAATPPFALVVRGDGRGSARVVARGPVRVVIGDTTVSGEGVSTWAERLIDGVEGEVRLESVDAAPSGERPQLPLVEGVVYAVAVATDAVGPVAAAAFPVSPAVDAAPAPAAPAPATAAAVPVVVPAAPSTPAPVSVASPAEQTMVPVEDTIASPKRSAPVTRPTPAAPAELEGDHDGLTVAGIDLQRLRAQRAARPATATPTPPSGVTVSPSASLRMPDGSLEPIGHEVVLGRAPSVSQVSGGRIPRLITIGAGDPDISRNHLRVAVEGDTVVVTDLHSRNGTHVVAPGKPPVKLRAGEPTPVLTGTVMDLGGGWTIQVVGE